MPAARVCEHLVRRHPSWPCVRRASRKVTPVRGDYTNVVNLTGHDVTVIQWNNETYTLPSEGALRVDSDMNVAGVIKIDGTIDVPMLEITERTLDEPPEVEGTVYIVSGIVAAKAGRDDFVVPARVVRENGVTVGCRAFARVKKG